MIHYYVRKRIQITYHIFSKRADGRNAGEVVILDRSIVVRPEGNIINLTFRHTIADQDIAKNTD